MRYAHLVIHFSTQVLTQWDTIKTLAKTLVLEFHSEKTAALGEKEVEETVVKKGKEVMIEAEEVVSEEKEEEEVEAEEKELEEKPMEKKDLAKAMSNDSRLSCLDTVNQEQEEQALRDLARKKKIPFCCYRMS